MDEVQEKLRKIRALAEDQQGTNEGYAALLAYQRMLKKYGMTDDDIKPDQIKVEYVTAWRGKRVPSAWVNALHTCIAKHFRCIAIHRRSYSTGTSDGFTEIQFAGLPDDANLAAQTFTAAKIVAECAAHEYGRNVDVDMRRGAASFYMGFVNGLDLAFNEQENSGVLDLIVTVPEIVKREADGLKDYKFSAPAINDAFAFLHGKTEGYDFLKKPRIQEGE